MTPLQHALECVARGWTVFPVSQDKAPRTPNGCKAASADPARIEAMHGEYGFVLIGIATGKASGLAVLDIDVKGGGTKWWQASRHRLPATRTHRTRSGGLHLLFGYPADGEVRNSASRIAPGVDTRGEGGYIVNWPAAGLPVLHDAPLADWPAWLVPAPKPAPEPRAWRSEGEPRPAEHIETALAGICREVATAAPGTRNDLLFWGAARCAEMSARGELSRRHAEALLIECATRIGLDANETRRTIASAFTRGAA